MSRDPEGPDAPHAHGTLSRREAIKKGLAVGSLPYVAPLIIGSAATASAQGISGFGCSTPVPDCDLDEEEGEEFLCGPGPGECLCFETVEGPSACIVPQCTDVSCGDSSDCPPGGVCIDLATVENCSDECEGEGLTRLCVALCSLPTLRASESSTVARQPFASRR